MLEQVLLRKTENDFLIQPQINLSYTLNSNLNLSTGVQSKYSILDLEKIHTSNPFNNYSSLDATSYYTDKLVSPYVGIQYNTSIYSIGLKVRYNIDDEVFFYSKPILSSLYQLDSIHISNYISMSLNYALQLGNLGVNLEGQYSLAKNEDRLPSFRSMIELDYKLLNEKLKLSLQNILQGSQQFQNGDLILQNESLYDINFRVDLYLNDRFSIYAQAVNLVDRQFQMLLEYPSYGRNFRGGLSVKF